MALSEAESNTEEKQQPAGELLFCGGTNWDTLGRSRTGSSAGNLVSPTRLRSLLGVDIRVVASGCSELAHSLLLFLRFVLVFFLKIISTAECSFLPLRGTGCGGTMLHLGKK